MFLFILVITMKLVLGDHPPEKSQLVGEEKFPLDGVVYMDMYCVSSLNMLKHV